MSVYLSQNENCCFQVDNKKYADSNWKILKDSSATFSENYSGGTMNLTNYKVGNLSVYPNPVHGHMSIDHNANIAESIAIFSVTGKKVMEIKRNQISIDVSSLPNGMYLLQVNYGKSIGHGRFIKN